MNELGPLILVIEDEAAMRRFLRVSLESNGYRWVEADTAREGLAQAAQRNPDLVLLDLGLPDVDGLDVTARLREWAKMPILVISARGQEEDKVRALDAGADDYLTKPFGVNELLARIRVALRHAQGTGGPSSPVIEIGDLKLDLDRREVFVEAKQVHLTPIEYKLLVLLAQHAGKVLTHRQILKEVWGPNQSEHTHYVRVHMAELRKKIEANPARPAWLVTEPGVGYRLRDRPAEDR
ncbi:MAG TPA: response regulator [Polyangiaceae bacterium]|jgi:two-component system KDP operon response regulator KdpE|nr:response regulator [Polyangiaceae bacterium]